MKHVNIYTILLAVGDYNESPSDLEQEYIYNNRGFFYTTPHFLDYLDETHKKIKLKKSSPRSYQINKTLKSYDQFLRIVMQDGQMQRY